ncbi:hypothetical protein [Agrococcus sp. KRD186]|jgi:hypothetical protein|uniref:hypothetical protein n=1 Tax=Agrococcus sp. KRD186 TaxID=2729730 RepID=UPI0019D22558|nr:hypothetical protein [Agrococcus sp. KRD186]
MVTRSTRATVAALVGGAALLLTGCASGPAPLSEPEITAVLAAIEPGSGVTVGDALALAREGTIGMIDARIATGVGQAQDVFEGAPPAGYHDWAIVATCSYGSSIPSIEVAAVPPADLDAAMASRGWNLQCDGGSDELLP